MLNSVSIKENKYQPVPLARSIQPVAGSSVFQLKDNRPESFAETNISQTYFTDNRPRSIIQKKQADALNDSVKINEDKGLESEADVMGNQASVSQFKKQPDQDSEGEEDNRYVIKQRDHTLKNGITQNQDRLPIQGFFVLNGQGQWEENNIAPLGVFESQPGVWLPMSQQEATRANLAAALRDAMESDDGGHIATIDTIAGIAEQYEDKPVQTVIFEGGLWMACWALAGEVIRTTILCNFNDRQLEARQKTVNARDFCSADINARGWIIRFGETERTAVRLIRIDEIRIIAYLINDGTFQFSVQLLHWSIRN